jgi:hypothetical protein
MQRQQLIVDSRLPDTSLAENDPAHPKNIVRNSMVLMNQASADTKYDATPPARIEAFSRRRFESFLPLATLITLFILIIFQLPFIVRIGLAIFVIYGLHNIVSKIHRY